MAPVKNAPRISVNKLAEFATAKSARQREILRDQKYPTDYKGSYYREAEEAVSLALASNLEDLSPVEKAIKVLDQMTPEKIGTARRIASNIDAMEAFLNMLDEIDLAGATPALGAQSPAKLTIHGVQVSVRPEIMLSGTGKSKGALVGALKLHFPRTNPLTDDSAGLVSAVVQEWCKINIDTDGNVYGPYCCVTDIGAQRFHCGVKSTIARMKDVSAACENIAGLWPTI